MSAIGKHVLVGLTYLDAEGEVEEQEHVVDPDFVATWTISPPEEGDGDA
jgi:hypothetical protein